MSGDAELYQLIKQSAEDEIRRNHLSAELHGDDMQRAIAALSTAKDLMGGVSETELLLELVKNPRS